MQRPIKTPIQCKFKYDARARGQCSQNTKMELEMMNRCQGQGQLAQSDTGLTHDSCVYVEVAQVNTQQEDEQLKALCTVERGGEEGTPYICRELVEEQKNTKGKRGRQKRKLPRARLCSHAGKCSSLSGRASHRTSDIAVRSPRQPGWLGGRAS